MRGPECPSCRLGGSMDARPPASERRSSNGHGTSPSLEAVHGIRTPGRPNGGGVGITSGLPLQATLSAAAEQLDADRIGAALARPQPLLAGMTSASHTAPMASAWSRRCRPATWRVSAAPRRAPRPRAARRCAWTMTRTRAPTCAAAPPARAGLRARPARRPRTAAASSAAPTGCARTHPVAGAWWQARPALLRAQQRLLPPHPLRRERKAVRRAVWRGPVHYEQLPCHGGGLPDTGRVLQPGARAPGGRWLRVRRTVRGAGPVVLGERGLLQRDVLAPGRLGDGHAPAPARCRYRRGPDVQARGRHLHGPLAHPTIRSVPPRSASPRAPGACRGPAPSMRRSASLQEKTCVCGWIIL
jgi:hypothetical protein